jgi:hypothetical protein
MGRGSETACVKRLYRPWREDVVLPSWTLDDFERRARHRRRAAQRIGASFATSVSGAIPATASAAPV